MVRARPARAHPPLYRQASARRDRARRRARFPALPVRLAACRARCAHGRSRRARRGGPAAGGFVSAGGGVGVVGGEGEEAVAERVGVGVVTSDSLGGLGALLVPSDRRKSTFANARRRRRAVAYGMEEAGRWALARRAAPGGGQASSDAVEHAARPLLARHRVVLLRALEP